MKKLILAVLILIPVGLAAQNKSFTELYGKYEGKEGYTCVSLGGDMLKASAANMTKGDSENKEEAAGILKNISSLKVLVAEKTTQAFRDDLDKMILESDFDTLLSVDDGGDKVKIYRPKSDVDKGDNEDKEMIIVVSEPDENVIVSIVGKGNVMDIMKALDEFDI